MPVGLLTIHLFFPGCSSLKEKRSRLKPVLARLHREFNVAAAEMDLQDHWREAVIACAMVSTDAVLLQKMSAQVIAYIETTWPDENIQSSSLEML
jgi:uncharacterized protein YlxP (DUF503 family)